MVKTLASQRSSPAAARADRSTGILEMAVRRHVRIDLDLESEVQPVRAYATILALAGPVLTLQFASGFNRNRLLAGSGRLRARFTLDGRRFEFDAEPAEDPVVARENLLALRRPETLRCVERRRVPRRRLQHSTTVAIEPVGAGNVVNAGLLNLSDFGLACRIARRDTEPLRTGTPVRARFTLSESEDAFAIGGRVVSLTPGSDGMWITGVEFDRGGEHAQELSRLRRALGIPANPVPETPCSSSDASSETDRPAHAMEQNAARGATP